MNSPQPTTSRKAFRHAADLMLRHIQRSGPIETFEGSLEALSAAYGTGWNQMSASLGSSVPANVPAVASVPVPTVRGPRPEHAELLARLAFSREARLSEFLKVAHAAGADGLLVESGEWIALGYGWSNFVPIGGKPLMLPYVHELLAYSYGDNGPGMASSGRVLTWRETVETDPDGAETHAVVTAQKLLSGALRISARFTGSLPKLHVEPELLSAVRSVTDGVMLFCGTSKSMADVLMSACLDGATFVVGLDDIRNSPCTRSFEMAACPLPLEAEEIRECARLSERNEVVLALRSWERSVQSAMAVIPDAPNRSRIVSRIRLVVAQAMLPAAEGWSAPFVPIREWLSLTPEHTELARKGRRDTLWPLQHGRGFEQSLEPLVVSGAVTRKTADEFLARTAEFARAAAS